MKGLISIIFLSALVLIVTGCGFGDWEVDELYAQKIEGTSKLLYKYDAWGGRDSHTSGFIILDSTETFQVSINNNLPFTYLLEIPNKAFVKGVSTECANSCGDDYKNATPIFTPIKQENIKSLDFNITKLVYQYKGFAERDGGFESFQFEKFKETRDSLWFYNLNEFEHGNNKHVDSLKFKKSVIAISQDKNSNIDKIVIEDLIIDRLSNEIISNITYHLTPKTKLNSKSFSDYGIFKGVVK
ncbi:hypothetical protein [Sediminibacterium sp.]|uniref:hypothetical protein n=1 Tax=Sediminibacterium sp. TaxID=1917865 RepID=UPI002736CDF3|nr:hypothetical protein [Sediminibacterium sp.]MDP3393033.1 hypothetical protein [Sediminibacterium sp.]MDP3567241.1 hypothetical protein [Sediminibacterium sp.]